MPWMSIVERGRAMKRVFQPWPVVCFSHYVRCRCDLEGKIRGKRCPDCDGWGVLLEGLPPRRPAEKAQTVVQFELGITV